MHIQNILYYNLKLFNELGLSAPTKFDELLNACAKIKQAKPEMTCLALGSKEKWGDTFVFDSILLEQGGPEYYVKLYKGEIDVANDPAGRSTMSNCTKAKLMWPMILSSVLRWRSSSS